MVLQDYTPDNANQIRKSECYKNLGTLIHEIIYNVIHFLCLVPLLRLWISVLKLMDRSYRFLIALRNKVFMFYRGSEWGDLSCKSYSPSFQYTHTWIHGLKGIQKKKSLIWWWKLAFFVTTVVAVYSRKKMYLLHT